MNPSLQLFLAIVILAAIAAIPPILWLAIKRHRQTKKLAAAASGANPLHDSKAGATDQPLFGLFIGNPNH